LRALADELQSPSHTSAEWQTTVQLDDSQLELLRRYDDLVRERVRRLRDGPSDGEVAFRELRQALDQREDLLTIGRSAPSLDPSLLLRAGAPRQADLEAIGLGDAVSRERTNYVVDSVAAYFAEGQRWKLARLAPTASEPAHWLYVGPGGQEAALLDEQAAADVPGAPSGAAAGTAVVDVTSQAGSAKGVLVSYTRWTDTDGRRLHLVEQWPDGAHHAYAGPLLRPGDLEVWPSRNPSLSSS
jgi:hypothetical protein